MSRVSPAAVPDRMTAICRPDPVSTKPEPPDDPQATANKAMTIEKVLASVPILIFNYLPSAFRNQVIFWSLPKFPVAVNPRFYRFKRRIQSYTYFSSNLIRHPRTLFVTQERS